MNAEELSKAEELYQLYMEGQRQRIPGARLHITFDLGFDCGSVYQAIEAIRVLKDRMIIIGGGIQSGRTASAMHFATMMASAGQPVIIHREMNDDMIERRWRSMRGLGSMGFIGDAFQSLNVASEKASNAMKWLASEAEKIQRLEYYDEPVNFCHGEVPPKQKKFRSYVPDKRAINRRNRKSKRK